jgi:hypothetical protein
MHPPRGMYTRLEVYIYPTMAMYIPVRRSILYPCGGLRPYSAAVYGRGRVCCGVCGRGRVQCGFIRAAMPAAYVRRYARPRAGALSGTEPRGSALASSRCAGCHSGPRTWPLPDIRAAIPAAYVRPERTCGLSGTEPPWNRPWSALEQAMA